MADKDNTNSFPEPISQSVLIFEESLHSLFLREPHPKHLERNNLVNSRHKVVY